MQIVNAAAVAATAAAGVRAVRWLLVAVAIAFSCLQSGLQSGDQGRPCA
jgi:hypothetical protein